MPALGCCPKTLKPHQKLHEAALKLQVNSQSAARKALSEDRITMLKEKCLIKNHLHSAFKLLK